MFRASFGSCSSRTLSDVIHRSIANPLPRTSQSFRRTGPTGYNYPPDPTGPFTLGDVLKIRLCPAAIASHAPPSPSFHHDWFNSDNEREEEDNDEEEEETESFFSSISLTSGSSERSLSRHGYSPDQPCVNVKESFAVVKSSRDPYRDFRRSMIEMIVEKEMFRAEDLVKLLECFLSLNSRHHHGVILEVFTNICEALIPHWSG